MSLLHTHGKQRVPLSGFENYSLQPMIDECKLVYLEIKERSNACVSIKIYFCLYLMCNNTHSLDTISLDQLSLRSTITLVYIPASSTQ